VRSKHWPAGHGWEDAAFTEGVCLKRILLERRWCRVTALLAMAGFSAKTNGSVPIVSPWLSLRSRAPVTRHLFVRRGPKRRCDMTTRRESGPTTGNLRTHTSALGASRYQHLMNARPPASTATEAPLPQSPFRTESVAREVYRHVRHCLSSTWTWPAGAGVRRFLQVIVTRRHSSHVASSRLRDFLSPVLFAGLTLALNVTVPPARSRRRKPPSTAPRLLWHPPPLHLAFYGIRLPRHLAFYGTHLPRHPAFYGIPPSMASRRAPNSVPHLAPLRRCSQGLDPVSTSSSPLQHPARWHVERFPQPRIKSRCFVKYRIKYSLRWGHPDPTLPVG